jgi:hypothetical protein
VWERKPTADQMLDARLERGWQPTVTATRDGDVFLGHAATRFGTPPHSGPPGSSVPRPAIP